MKLSSIAILFGLSKATNQQNQSLVYMLTMRTLRNEPSRKHGYTVQRVFTMYVYYLAKEQKMITEFEKWLFLGIGFVIVAMIVGAGLGMHNSTECRLELAKAGRSADDIRKICP